MSESRLRLRKPIDPHVPMLEVTTGARRLLVERGVHKSQLDLVGYWRHGHGYM